MDFVLTAVISAALTAWIGSLVVASAEVRRHDRQVVERDEDLEEWLITRNRDLKREQRRISNEAASAGQGTAGATAGQLASAGTIALYEYRERLRQARAFVLRVEAEEMWTHRLIRLVGRSPLPTLRVPDKAAPLLDFWAEGTARNALTFSLDDMLAELPSRTPSKAKAV